MPIDFSKFQKKAEVKKKPEEKSGLLLKNNTEKKAEKPKKTKKEIKIKTDHFRTGMSLITGASKRDKPPVLKQKLLEFLENHELKESKNKWYWIKIKNGVGK